MAVWWGLAWFVLGAAVGVLGWCAGHERLRPGHWAGLRTAATLRSDQAWYAGQTSGGAILQSAGGLVAATGLLLMIARPVPQTVVVVSLFLGVGLVGGVVAAFIVGSRAARETVDR